ncbi:MAG: hypothetical protein ABIR39_07180 [Nocardioides sp.]|uniref:hypothetical protein n=1 Tax=Nocardioides sp. TaxID=35761 RepID=UPI003265917D
MLAVVFFRRELISVLSAGRLVLALWAAYAGTAAVGALFIESRLPWGSGSLVAGLDNALLPLATITVVGVWSRLVPVPLLLRTVSWMVVVAMALNGALAVVTSFVGFDGIPLLPRFWAAGGSGVTVAELAAGSGRYSGIFNQPAEAGVAYCLAAFCLIYLLRTGTDVSRKLWVAAWALIIIGGMMTLSKVFIVGGVLISAVLILTKRPHRMLLTVSAVVTVLVTAGLGALGWLGTWGASGMLGWYVASARAGDSLAYTLSAGRFGRGGENVPPVVDKPVPTDGATGLPSEFEQPGGLVELAKEILANHPWFGLGARGAPVSYDSTWIEAIVVAGSVGALLVLAVHVVLLVRWIRLRVHLPREQSRLAGAVVILAWGSSFGMPSLTGNRESSLMWILLSLLVIFRIAGERDRGDLEEHDDPSGRLIR